MPLEYTSSFFQMTAILVPSFFSAMYVAEADALVGVGEAHLEHVVLALDGSGGGSGGGQRKDAVLVGLQRRWPQQGLEVTEPRDSCMPQSFRVL